MTSKPPTIEDFAGGSPIGRPDEPAFKKGRPSDHALGVLYQGPCMDEADGFNEHTRRCARALALIGCPVHLRSSKAHVQLDTPKALPGDVAALLTASISKYSVMIHQMIPRPSALQNITTHRFLSLEELAIVNRFRVISTVIERDRVGADIVSAMNRVGQVWVACGRNASLLSAQGVKDVRVVPIPHFQDEPLLLLRGRVRRPGPVRFYHIGKWEPRKAQDQIITAFMRAFKPGQAQLILKCSTMRTKLEGYPLGPEQAIVELLEKDVSVQKNGWNKDSVDKFIEIVSGRLSPESMVALHRFGDVYMTLSRGEGFDMPAYDAKLAGNLMVYTPSGGPQDFAGDADVMVSASWSMPCHKFYGWEEDACYLDYDIGDAVQAMRLADSRIWTKEINDLSLFTAESVGRRMLSNLEDMVRPVDGRVF